MRATLLLVLFGFCLTFAGCFKKKRAEVYAVGSLTYHAAPIRCSVEKNPHKAIQIHANHYLAKGSKGIVYEAMKPGQAVLRCGDKRTTVIVRKAARIELYRTDGKSTPIPLKDLYAPQFCVKVFDNKGRELKLGYLSKDVQFTTSEHLHSITNHGMGGPGNAACLRLQKPVKTGKGTVEVLWRGMDARTFFEVK